jgi:hypothetical protein
MRTFFRHPGEVRDLSSLKAQRLSPNETPACAGVTEVA